MLKSKRVFDLSLLLLIMLLEYLNAIQGLTVDNHLVQARNDCFERVALEAMLPIEKTFRTEDTNSLKMCKEACTQAGDKCQSIAFGVHRRGNGTCQLSTEKFATSNGRRPSGIIFDPDFDLYARKTNCFDLTDNSIPQQESVPVDGVSGGAEGYGGVVASNQPLETHSSFSNSGLPTVTVVNPFPTTSSIVANHSPSLPPLPPPTLVFASTQFHTESPATTEPPTTASNRDRLYFSHDIYPLYKYPTPYNGHTSNASEVGDQYMPTQPVDDYGRLWTVFGLGYGNGYSYGKPQRYGPTTNGHPYNQGLSTIYPPTTDQSRPGDSHYYTGPYDNNRPTQSPPKRHDRPADHPSGTSPNQDQISPTYFPRPEYTTSTGATHASQNNVRPTHLPVVTHANRPFDPFDYANRPDPPQQHQQDYGVVASVRPNGNLANTGAVNESSRYDFVRKNGTAMRPAGAGNTNYSDDKTIATFFNPDDYHNQKRRPGFASIDRNRVGYPMDAMKACFRRVLAGKRIAPHWVRRTIACERVEECMRECGNEKRFSCEGFNYRLDPSGHGQGDCELVEVPLEEMDLYSSPHRRDSNLLRHPDYDYYERDRNAPSSCRRNICKDCSKIPLSSPPLYVKPGSGWNEKPIHDEHHVSSVAVSGGGYDGPPPGYVHHYSRPSDTAVDYYRPKVRPSAGVTYIHRPPTDAADYHSSSYDFSPHDSAYFEHTPPSSYGGSGSGSSSSSGSLPIDRYDLVRPDEYRYRHFRPDRWQSIPSSSNYDSGYHPRPGPDHTDKFRPPYRPGPDYSPYRPSSYIESDVGPGTSPGSSSHFNLPPPPSVSHNYLDRGGPPSQTSSKFVPYLLGTDNDWDGYGGSYGSNYNKQSAYWGLHEYGPRKDNEKLNYYDVGSSHGLNSVIYGGVNYDSYDTDRDHHNYRHQWTRRPGPDECSAKTSEGFRLHKTVVKYSSSVPTLTECERLCSGQNHFVCHTYSYRYSPMGRDNCMLCDRPVNTLDYYVDIEPDRDYDIYSMTDDLNSCVTPSRSDVPTTTTTTALSNIQNAQCFFRAIDATRFFKSIVRDSLTVRSVGQCELECIKSTKFTCRAFAYRYGKQSPTGIIDNCQLSDWPVRDMDKTRHLISDPAFDVFERASYGHGCELQPIMDPKHKKSVCYLGYGAPAKLLSTAIKKVISAPTEVDCKKECIRFRETTQFKCNSFSFGTRAKSYNCEMSDLDQTELKLNVHYVHTHERDYWLFAWNPFDWTCRDKVTTIGGTRVNNDRRMDIFREPGDLAWRHYTVSGKACRRSSPCAKNLVTGFYSCETERGEIGAWDYCCKFDHPCGYSQGFDYPWCFVGDELDQWRKCSDRYYPGNHTQTQLTTISKPSKKKLIPSSLIHHTTRSSLGSSTTNQNEYQRPPRPGGLHNFDDFTAARLWPVTYLYSEGPPNSTEFSNFVDCNKESC